MMMKKDEDRIEKAAALAKQNAFVKVNGEWRFIDGNLSLSYTLTRSSCSCPDFQIHNTGARNGRIACKHFLGLWGSKVAAFIVKMRQTATLDELLALVNEEAPRLASEMPEFVALANHHYHLEVGRVRQESPRQAVVEAEQAPRMKAERKYKSSSINRNGERLHMIQAKPLPMFYGAIEI
jgi:hypothetical protein